MDDRIVQLLDRRQSGWSLPRDFYTDEAIYREEVDKIWRRFWLFAGHSCEAKKPGDYFTYELDNDSLVLMRQDDGSLKALYNTCRHRGSRLVTQEKGNCKGLVCPYHQWSYAKDGIRRNSL